MNSPISKHFLITVLLFTLAFGFYARTGSFGWLTSEDLAYTLDNPYLVKQFTDHEGQTYSHSLAASLKHCFTTLHYSQWIPLPLMVHKVMLEFFGSSPGPQHLLNALLHGFITALVYLLFTKLTRRPLAVALGCILLAVHPQHVQLVAWVAELKDLLAYLFATLSALAYLCHIDRPSSQKKKRVYLMLSLIFFAIALSCRFIVAGLPLMLGTFHLFRERKMDWRILQPHLFLSVCMLLFTGYLLHYQEARFGLDLLSLTERIGPLFYVPFQYLEKTVLCYPLTFFNPFPQELSLWISLLSLLVLILLTGLAWKCRSKHPELSLAWLWHLAALLPVCGIFTIGPNHYSDHYSYLPHIALFPCLFICIEKLLPSQKPALLLACIGILLALPTAYCGWKQMTPQKSTVASMTLEGNIQSDFDICLTSALLVNQGLSTRSGTQLEAPQRETALKILVRALTDPHVVRSEKLTAHPDYKKVLTYLEDPAFTQSLKNNAEELQKIILIFKSINAEN